MSILTVTNLVKNFGDFKAVNKISFEIPKGKVIGLLGPNGAGKTTTIHMLLGITTPSSGQITYFGQDFSQNRQAALQRINYVSAYNILQLRISVWENLLVFAGLYGVEDAKQKIEQLLEIFDISSLKDKKYQDLSSGQQTRVNLAKSLINDPELILMDEPTASLDPDITDRTLSLIEKLKVQNETSILFTSHNMDEVARLCDQVVFLDRGKIVKKDTPIALAKAVGSIKLNITFEGPKEGLVKFLKSKNLKHKFTHDYFVTVNVEESQVAGIIQAIASRGVKILDIDIKKPDLEDVFLQIARRQRSRN